MSENKPQYYKKSLDFAKESSGQFADIEYLGDYEGYEVYQVVYENEVDQPIVGDFILANDEMVYKSYYHESVDIASKFNR